MSDNVTLFHWEPNANSGKPMLALAEKGVAFESHYLDLLNFDQHKPDYLKINPQGTIPAMIHGDRVLTESTAIMEYADAAFDGPALMPKDPRDRWRVRWWMKFMDQWLGPSFSMIGWSIFVGPSVRARDPQGAGGGDRAHPAARAPHRLAQGDLQSLLRGGAGRIEPPDRRRHRDARRGAVEAGVARQRPIFARRRERLQSRLRSCPCRSPISPMTRRRRTSWNGCARFTSGRRPGTSGRWAERRWWRG